MKRTKKRVSLKGNPPLVANRISTLLSWQDLPISKKSKTDLTTIKNRRSGRNSNYQVLFDGPKRSGKAVVACLLGRAYKNDVYRFEVPRLLSSGYIGETEKNLSKMFDRAVNKQWVLFFDEADALFGKRTNVAKKGSSKGYANQEVSYLLQRIEAHPGLVILSCESEEQLTVLQRKQFKKIIKF